MAKDFGVRLRELRRSAGLTQAELAWSLGVGSVAYISKLELGQAKPSLELVLQIAEFFGVTTDHVLVRVADVSTDEIVDVKQSESSRRQSRSRDAEIRMFGAKLRSLRRQRRWTQAVLAEQLSLASQSYVSMLESGVQSPSLEIVLSVADLFKVNVEELVRDSVPIEYVQAAPPTSGGQQKKR